MGEIKKAWLAVASRSRVFAGGTVILMKLEQGGLGALRLADRFQLRPAQFAKLPPAVGVAVDHEEVGVHDAAPLLARRCSGRMAGSFPFSACFTCAAMTSRAKLSGAKPGSSSPPMAIKLR